MIAANPYQPPRPTFEDACGDSCELPDADRGHRFRVGVAAFVSVFVVAIACGSIGPTFANINPDTALLRNTALMWLWFFVPFALYLATVTCLFVVGHASSLPMYLSALSLVIAIPICLNSANTTTLMSCTITSVSLAIVVSTVMARKLRTSLATNLTA